MNNPLVPQAFAGQPTGLRPTTTEGVPDAASLRQGIAPSDLRGSALPQQPVIHVPGLK
jgi:hypothetical protein